MWDRACRLFHTVTGTCLADDIFTSKKIYSELYFYNTNTSDFITDEIIELVKEKHRSYSRKADEDSILSVEHEFEINPDIYYYVLGKLGWKRVKHNYLVKALAGALS